MLLASRKKLVRLARSSQQAWQAIRNHFLQENGLIDGNRVGKKAELNEIATRLGSGVLHYFRKN